MLKLMLLFNPLIPDWAQLNRCAHAMYHGGSEQAAAVICFIQNQAL